MAYKIKTKDGKVAKHDSKELWASDFTGVVKASRKKRPD